MKNDIGNLKIEVDRNSATPQPEPTPPEDTPATSDKSDRSYQSDTTDQSDQSYPPESPETDPESEDSEPQSESREAGTRTGKVARLPVDVRETVNRMLQNGIRFQGIINYLDQIGHSGFHHYNISRWKKGGYKD